MGKSTIWNITGSEFMKLVSRILINSWSLPRFMIFAETNLQNQGYQRLGKLSISTFYGLPKSLRRSQGIRWLSVPPHLGSDM